jgi:hypothetical protein
MALTLGLAAQVKAVSPAQSAGFSRQCHRLRYAFRTSDAVPHRSPPPIDDPELSGQGEGMNTWKISALIGIALLATTAFAADKASLHLDRSVVVNGKELAAGKYTLTWDGTSGNVDLSISRGNDVVVKTPARLVDVPKASALTLVVTKNQADGSAALSEIQLQGKKYVLDIGPEDSAAGTATAKK